MCGQDGFADGFSVLTGDPQARRRNGFDDLGTWKVRSIPLDIMVEVDNKVIYGGTRSEVQPTPIHSHSINSVGRWNVSV
jgi:hypothetical protein